MNFCPFQWQPTIDSFLTFTSVRLCARAKLFTLRPVGPSTCGTLKVQNFLRRKNGERKKTTHLQVICVHTHIGLRDLSLRFAFFLWQQPVTYRVSRVAWFESAWTPTPKLSKSRINVRSCNIMNQKLHGSFASSEGLSLRTVLETMPINYFVNRRSQHAVANRSIAR